MKQQRERSIRTVAETRFNYERLTRELARILPAGVWVGHLEVAPAVPEESVVEAGADSRRRVAGAAARDDGLGLRAQPGRRRRHARPPARAHERDERGARLVEAVRPRRRAPASTSDSPTS